MRPVERLPVAVRLAALLLACAVFAVPAQCQQIRGRVHDAANDAPVQLAGVWLLDGDREQVALAMADSVGRYFLTVPGSGEYFIVADRFGYFATESPLLAISGDRDYELDLELRPEPIGIAALDVTVRNEQVVEWLTLEREPQPRGGSTEAGVRARSRTRRNGLP